MWTWITRFKESFKNEDSFYLSFSECSTASLYLVFNIKFLVILLIWFYVMNFCQLWFVIWNFISKSKPMPFLFINFRWFIWIWSISCAWRSVFIFLCFCLLWQSSQWKISNDCRYWISVGIKSAPLFCYRFFIYIRRYWL